MKTPSSQRGLLSFFTSMLLVSLAAPNAFGANGTASYIDFDGANPGFGTPGGTISETATIWSTASAGNVATTARPSSTQMTIGAIASDFAGQTFSINIDGAGNLNGILFNSTSANVTFTGSANTHLNAAQTWTVPAGSTLTVNTPRQGFDGGGTAALKGFNYNNQVLTINGAGTYNFPSPLGANDSTGSITVNMTGSGAINLQMSSTGLSGGGTYTCGLTLTAGTVNFASAGSVNQFYGFAANKNFAINGGKIDNTSGAPLSLVTMTNGGGIEIGGSFTFVGTGNLNLGNNNVVISNSTPTITVSGSVLTLGGTVSDAAGTTFGLTKAGAGVLALSGVNTYSGATTVNAGELVGVTGGSVANSAVTVASGATNGVQVSVANGQWTCSSLTYSSGTPYLDFNFGGIGAGTVAPIQAGNLTFSGTPNVIVKSTSIIQQGTYPLIKYTGSLSGTAPTTVFAFPPSPNVPYTGYVSNDVATTTLYLVVTGGPSGMIWTGANGSSWDISTLNWSVSGSPSTYSDGNALTFNDTASTGTVNLQQSVTPTSMTVSNNSLTYTFGDGGSGFAITGAGVLTKQGPGTLIVDNAGGMTASGGVNINSGVVQVGNNDGNGSLGTGPIANSSALQFNRSDAALVLSNVISGAGGITNNGSGTVTLAGGNTFTGPVMVNTGTLKVNNNSALGSTNGATTVASGASLDLNARDIGQEPVFVSGTGVDAGAANGALFNSGASTPGNQAITRLTLLGDTTVGGSGRWDLRSTATGDANGSSLSTGGNAYNLTKVGANQVSLTGVSVDPNLADIDIKNGMLSVESATTGLGNPARTLSVRSGATLQMFALTNVLNKNIVMEVNSALNSASANNTIVGPIVLTNGMANFGVSTNTTLTLTNVISGVGGVNKTNTGMLVIAGTDTYSGGTVVNDGTFILNTINANVANALMENNSLLGVAQPPVVGGNGTNVGPVTIFQILHPGAGGKPSTFGVGGAGVSSPALFLDGGSGSPTAIFDLGSSTTVGNGVNDLVNVMGDLNITAATLRINPVAPLSTNGTYTLFTFTGGLSGNFSGAITTVTTSRYSFTVNYLPNSVTLGASGGPVLLKWNNAAANTLWDVQSSGNWLNTSTAGNDNFYNFDSVLLDDTVGTGNFTISNSVTVSPAGVTNDSSTANYTLIGNGKITGAAGLTKRGTSTLTIATTNDFTGNVLVAGGTIVTLWASNGVSSLGSIPGGTVTITNGGTVDFTGTTNNCLAFATTAGQAKQFVIAGSGVGGNGALVNNGVFAQQNVLQALTLTANASIGGVTRWDMRGAAVTPSINLNGFTLTKTGANQMSLVNIIITNTGSIVINGGTFSVETASVVSNNTITVNSGGSFGHFRSSANSILSPITLNGGAITNLAGGGATNDAPITLAANSFISHATGNDLYLRGVISGSGGLTKNGTGTTILTATETYTGDTVINSGAVTIPSTASIASSANVTIASGATLTMQNASGLSGVSTITDNGELDISGAGGATLTLNNGQTFGGSGHVTGIMVANNGSTVAPGGKGTVGTLTVGSTVTLHGTTYIDVNNNGTSVDHLTCGSVNYGGTLLVTNLDLAHPFTTNTTLSLFSAGVYSGAFTNIIPATPGAGLIWNTNSLTINGVLSVTNAPSAPSTPPRFTGVSFSGTTLTITATNGPANGQFVLLNGTNLLTPLSQWVPVLTNTFDGSGHLNLSTNIVNRTNVQNYYVIQQ